MRVRNTKTRQNDASGCLMAFALGSLTVLGGLGLYFTAFQPIANILEARTWVAIQCAIVSSRLIDDRDEGHRVEVIYTYDYDGRSHRGSRLDFDAGEATRKDLMTAIVEAYPVGAELDCWVDPDDPTRSVIDRSPGSFLWWGLLPLAFLAIAAAGIVFLLIVRGVIPYRPSA